MAKNNVNTYRLKSDGVDREVTAVSVEVTQTAIFGTDGDGDVTFAVPVQGSSLILIKKGEDNG